MSKNTQRFYHKKTACLMGSYCLSQISVAPPWGRGVLSFSLIPDLTRWNVNRNGSRHFSGSFNRQTLVWLTCCLFSLTRKHPERRPHQPAFQNEDDMNQSSSCLERNTAWVGNKPLRCVSTAEPSTLACIWLMQRWRCKRILSYSPLTYFRCGR